MLTPIFCISVAVAAAFLYFKFLYVPQYIQKIRRDLSGLGIAKSYAMFKYTHLKTPKGVELISTVRVPQTAMETIDRAIEKLIEDTRAVFPSWKYFLTPSDYAIVIVDPMYTNQETEPGSPSILVAGQPSAGTNIGVGPHPAADRNYLVIPHQEESGWKYDRYLFNSVYNEGQHSIEFQNDLDVWFYYTGPNDVHPHDYTPFVK